MTQSWVVLLTDIGFHVESKMLLMRASQTSSRACGRGESRRILPDELLHTQRRLPRQRKHVVRHPVITSRAVQIGHRHEVIHQVNRQAVMEQPFLPRPNRNVLKGDRAAQRL